MAENYEFISAANLPTTDAKEVDVICVEGGELKRKPGASIGGGGGGYVVRLPADTPMQIDEDGVNVSFMPTESYDNFMEVLYNGGSVLIDASATMLGQSMGNGFAILNPNAWSIGEGAFVAIASISYRGQQITFQIAFLNGTWTPPTAE